MIGLADCNNFYASCERVFNPRLINKPIVVLSNNDGCVIARSNEAKSLGIKMGQPAFQIKKIICENNVSTFSSNFCLYGDLSKRVMDTLKTEIPIIEIYSIDEAFLDFSRHINYERATYIKNKVQKWTGIPISIGIAKTKSLAKVANHVAKNHAKKNVFILQDEYAIKHILNRFPIENLWGIGKRFSKKLKQANINTALEFRSCKSTWIKKHFSSNAVKLQKELYGENCYSLNPQKKQKKSICTSRSFKVEIQNFNVLQGAISSFASNCAYKLRKENSCCSKVSVFLMTNRFNINQGQHCPSVSLEFDTATNDSLEIISQANRALKLIYDANKKYKKAGVVVHKIIKKEYSQISLFDNIDRKKRTKLMDSIDAINSSMGKNKIRVGLQGYEQLWSTERAKLSPCYTTQFKDILKIYI